MVMTRSQKHNDLVTFVLDQPNIVQNITKHLVNTDSIENMYNNICNIRLVSNSPRSRYAIKNVFVRSRHRFHAYIQATRMIKRVITYLEVMEKEENRSNNTYLYCLLRCIAGSPESLITDDIVNRALRIIRWNIHEIGNINNDSQYTIIMSVFRKLLSMEK